MSEYTIFHETKYMSFLRTYDELLEKQNKIWDKVSNNSIRKDFIVNQCKLKQNLIKEKLAQIFMMMEYQKKVFIAFVYKIGKTTILKCFQKNVSSSLKKKGGLDISLLTKKFILMILIKKILIQKIKKGQLSIKKVFQKAEK